MVAFTQPASYSLSGTLAAVGDSIVVETHEANSVSAAIVGGTFSSFNVAFEVSWNSTNGSDGTWVAVQGSRNNANTIETTSGTLSSIPAYFWEVDTSGAPWFRIRCTARTSGSQVWSGLVRAVAMDVTPQTQIAGTPNVNVVNNPAMQMYTAGSTLRSLISAASTNATSWVNSACSLVSLNISNTGASTVYFKLFNKNSAPVLGTDAPLVTIPIPAGGFVSPNLGTFGQRFSAGLAFAITAGASATDATALGAVGDVRVLGTTVG